MNSRQRVLAAIDHQTPDRVPVDLGGTGVSSGAAELQQAMRQVLGLRQPRDPRFPYFDNGIQEYFGCDLRRIGMRGPRFYQPRFDAQGRRLDEWGVHDYNDSAHNPLRHLSAEDLQTYPWPDPYDPGRVEGLREYARFLHEETEYAIAADAPSQGFFEAGCRFRGYDQFLLDFAMDPDWVRAFFDKMLELMRGFVEVYVGAIGDYIDIIWLGDDACTQRGPYIRPEMYRRLVKPYFQEYIQHIKKFTRARIMHHCCGSCYSLIPDYLDIGIEVLTPGQPEATHMEAWRLKQSYGDRMTFHGGIGLQYILPQGSPAEIEANVRETARILGQGGGYILAAGHTPPEDVTAESMIVMLEAAKNLTYPL